MRSPAMKNVTRVVTITVVLMSLVVAAYSQTQSSSRVRRQSEWQQSRQMQSQGGQLDFMRRMKERQARQMQEMQQDMAQMQQDIEEMKRWAEENRNQAIQQTLRASDDQWRQIKPKLDRIERLKAEAEVSAGPDSGGNNGNFQGQGFMFGGVAAGGAGAAFGDAGGMGPTASSDAQGDNWGSAWTTGPKDATEMTPGEALCQELHHLLQGESVSPLQIAEKVGALRQVRAKAREDLARARQELRGLMLPQQEPALIVMGYLD
jgi:TolA-binding protein